MLSRLLQNSDDLHLQSRFYLSLSHTKQALSGTTLVSQLPFLSCQTSRSQVSVVLNEEEALRDTEGGCRRPSAPAAPRCLLLVISPQPETYFHVPDTGRGKVSHLKCPTPTVEHISSNCHMRVRSPRKSGGGVLSLHGRPSLLIFRFPVKHPVSSSRLDNKACWGLLSDTKTCPKRLSAYAEIQLI